LENDFNDDIHHPHDKSYKFLLSSKRIFIELLQSFVDRGWVEQIDESHLIKVDKSYILQDFREKEADLVYRMQIKDRQIIFYVLMEMQSRVDFQMPYRLLLYMVEVWRDISKNASSTIITRKDFKLPAIVPIVLYNGVSPWTACRSFRETLDSEEWFGNELLDFKYILIDIQRYGEAELMELSNLIGTIFLLERKPDIHTFVQRMEQMTGVLENLPNDVFPIFQTWIKLITNNGLSDVNKRKLSTIIDQYGEPKEVRAMISNLEKAFEDFEFNAEKRGIEQGISKGIAQGKFEVARTMLQKGMDISFIAEMTGLTKEEVEQSKKMLP
jgi:predicted transposase/invertase (TIGR01784 family)